MNVLSKKAQLGLSLKDFWLLINYPITYWENKKIRRKKEKTTKGKGEKLQGGEGKEG